MGVIVCHSRKLFIGNTYIKSSFRAPILNQVQHRLQNLILLNCHPESCILHPASCIQYHKPMNRPRILLCLLLIFFLISWPLQAQETTSRKYLPVGSIDGAALIGPPAAIGSPEFKSQMAIVLWLQLTRTPEQIAFVEKTLNFERFTPILGDSLLRVDGALLKKTLDDAVAEVRDDYDQVKARFNLPRPYQVSDQVKPVGDARPVASYPSGHAIRATVYARLLSEIFPEHRDALTELGLQVGYGRVIAGVHYPMDITSGQKLGNAYADVIIQQKAFQDAVSRMRGK